MPNIVQKSAELRRSRSRNGMRCEGIAVMLLGVRAGLSEQG